MNGNSLFLQTPFFGVRSGRGSRHSDCHCTWALDVEIPPLVTLPWRGLLFCCLLCLPSSGGFLLGPCGRVCVCVCGGVRVGVRVRVPAGLRCCLESRFLHVSMFFVKEPRKDFRLKERRVFIMDDCDELIPEWFEFCERYVVNSEALVSAFCATLCWFARPVVTQQPLRLEPRVSSPRTRAHS